MNAARFPFRRFLGLAVVVAALPVGARANDIWWQSLSMPASGVGGTTVTVTATVENNSGETWGSGHYLALQDPTSFQTGQGLAATPPSLDGIEAGGSITVSFALTLPTTAGTYTYYLRGVEYGVEYFGEVQIRTITVTAPPPATPVTLSATSFRTVALPTIATTDSIVQAPYYRLRAKVNDNSSTGYHAAVSWNNHNRSIDSAPPAGYYGVCALYWVRYDAVWGSVLQIGPETFTPLSVSGGTVRLSTYTFGGGNPARIYTDEPMGSAASYRLFARLSNAQGATFETAGGLNNNNAVLTGLPPPGEYSVALSWKKYDTSGTAFETSPVFPAPNVTITGGPIQVLTGGGYIYGTDWENPDDGTSGTDYSVDQYDFIVPVAGILRISTTGLSGTSGDVWGMSYASGYHDIVVYATPGAYHATVTANAWGDYQVFGTLTPSSPPPVITSAATAGGTVGSPFTFQITATNGATFFGANYLPPGLSVNPSNGLISGTPTTAGIYSVLAVATNSVGPGGQWLTITISGAPQSITFAPLPNRLTSEPSFAVAATASSGLPVSFSVASGPATISGATVSLTGTAGTVTIRAAQPGNSNYAAAADVIQSFQVTTPSAGGGGTAPQTITFPAIGTKTYGGPAVALTATASSGLPVTFAVLSGPATLGGNMLTLTGVGPVVVRASQAGNGTYQAAPTVDQAFNAINPAGTTLGADGSIWYDVTGDGIRDEIIRANTPRFTVRITELDDPDELGDINSNWRWGDMHNSDGPSGSTNYPNYRWDWLPWVSDPWATVEYNFEVAPGYEYVVFGETRSYGSTTGRYGDDVANWPKSHIGGVLQRHGSDTPDVTRLSVEDSGLLVVFVDVSYYLIRLGQEIRDLQIKDPSGNVLVENVAVDGTVDLVLPSTRQVIINPRDIANQFIAPVHNVSWRITNLTGTVLRVGVGSVVNFDDLPIGALQLWVLLDAAAPKKVNVVTHEVLVKQVVFVDAYQYLYPWNGDFANVAPPGQTATPIGFRGWSSDGINNPVCLVRGTTQNLDVTVAVTPASTTFQLRGFNPSLGLTFTSETQTATGADQVVRVQASQALPSALTLLEGTLGWSVGIGGAFFRGNDSGPHKIYVTWEPPRAEAVTMKRLDWAVRATRGATSVAEAGLKIRDSLATWPGYGDGTGLKTLPDVNNNAWEFLDENSPGDCSMLAHAAYEGLGIVGVGAVGPRQGRLAWPTPDGSAGYPALSSSSCRQKFRKQFEYNGQQFWARLKYPGNQYEGFFTVGTEPSLVAYTVYPKGKAENQTYYYLEVLRIGTANYDNIQYWGWDGNQEAGGESVRDGAGVPGSPNIYVPAVPLN